MQNRSDFLHHTNSCYYDSKASNLLHLKIPSLRMFFGFFLLLSLLFSQFSPRRDNLLLYDRSEIQHSKSRA